MIFILAFAVLPSAVIKVKARTEPVTRDFEIRVDAGAQKSSSENLVVPGKVIEKEITGSKSYGATGVKNVGKTASGFIQIYNFSKTSLILKAQTTVLTASGRKYYFTQDVGSIRPTAKIGLDDLEVDPSSLVPPVPLVGGAPGEEYNLPKGARLEISNEAFGSRPQELYAIVAEDISGGTTKQVKFITQGDIDSAQQALSNVLLVQAKTEMKFLDNAVAMQVLEHAAKNLVGTEAVEFEVSQKVKVRALTYDEVEVHDVMSSRIKRLLPETKVLRATGESFDLKFASVNLDAGSGVLAAHFEGQIVYKLDSQEILGKVRGKTVAEIREIFLSKPEIASLSVEFSPFWVKTAPSFGGKTSVTIEN